VRPEGLGKFKISPHRISEPGPSDLKPSALTTRLPRAPIYIYTDDLNLPGGNTNTVKQQRSCNRPGYYVVQGEHSKINKYMWAYVSGHHSTGKHLKLNVSHGFCEKVKVQIFWNNDNKSKLFS
jgi:hypothetical protein